MLTTCKITGEPNCHCRIKSEPFLKPSKKDSLRKLFTDHAVYTKFFYTAFLDSRPEANFLLQRLLDNQTEIGIFFGQFFGPQIGNIIGNLFTEHIKLAGEILRQLKNNHNIDFQGSQVLNLVKNIEDVAVALSKISSGKLTYEIVYNEFLQHNKFIIELAKLHLIKHFKEEIITYDQFYNHMLHFSDLLCAGLLY